MKEGGRSGWTMDNLNRAEENGLREVRLKVYRTIIVPPSPSIKFVSLREGRGSGGRGKGLVGSSVGSSNAGRNRDSKSLFFPFPSPPLSVCFPVPFPRNRRFPRAYHCLLDFFRPPTPTVARLSLGRT